MDAVARRGCVEDEQKAWRLRVEAEGLTDVRLADGRIRVVIADAMSA